MSYPFGEYDSVMMYHGTNGQVPRVGTVRVV